MEKVIIYCAAAPGERVAYTLDSTKYVVVGFLDDNPLLWGEKYCGSVIYPPEKIKELEYDYIIISAAEYEEIIRKKLLEEYCVDNACILGCQKPINGISCAEERIVMLRRCMDIIQERNITGNMAEVGVYTGEFAKLMNKHMPERKLYLFDTFNGFASDKDEVDECDLENFKDTSVELVLSKMSAPENCIIRQGYFPDTCEGLEDEFCLVSLDCDLYNPILAGLEYFYPRLVKGGYIFVHDFGNWHYTGVKKAVYKYLETHSMAIVPIVDLGRSIIITK